MQTPFEMAWLILKQNQTSDIQPVALNTRGPTYRQDMPVLPDTTTPTVENYYKDRFRQLQGETPSESYADKIKRLLAEDEARNTYQDLPPPSNTFDLGNMEPYTKLGQPSSPPTPSV